MTYIFLVAGKGTRLHPLTLNYPKTLFRLDNNDTILQRMVKSIRAADPGAEIVVVTGFKHRTIEQSVSGVTYVYNPFYEVTNSIASLWFARQYMDRDQITILNGDIVTSIALIKDILCVPVEEPSVLYDSSMRQNGDYNVQIRDGQIIVMSKEISEYDGEYAGITKLPRRASRELLAEMDEMIEDGQYMQWYENSLVQMIFKQNYIVKGIDVSAYKWTEVDSVDDMALAKEICQIDRASQS